MEDLHRTIARSVEEAVADLRHEFEGRLESYRKRLESALKSALPEASKAPATADHKTLLDAFREIESGTSQSSILNTLLATAGKAAGRAAFLLTPADDFLIWNTSGFEVSGHGTGEDPFTVPEQGPWRQARSGHGHVHLSAGDCALLCSRLGSPLPGEGVLIPFLLQGRVAGLLYADSPSDDGLSVEQLALLTWAAARTIETLPFRERPALGMLRPATDSDFSEPPLPLWTPPEAETLEPEAEAAAELQPEAETPSEEATAVEEVEEPSTPEFQAAPQEEIEEAPAEDGAEVTAEAEERPTVTETIEAAEEEPALIESEMAAVEGEDVTEPSTFAEPVEELATAEEEESAIEQDEALQPAELEAETELPEEEEPELQLETEAETAEIEEPAGEVETPEPLKAAAAPEAKDLPLSESALELTGAPSAEEAVSEETVAEEAVTEEAVPEEAVAEEIAAEPEPGETVDEPSSAGDSAPEFVPSSQFEVAPPSDLTGPGWAFTTRNATSDEEAFHSEAKRLARLLVSEIKLYHEVDVWEGRRKGNVYGELQDEIDRSRLLFDERVDEEIRSKRDYFYEELVRQLADGNADVLGL